MPPADSKRGAWSGRVRFQFALALWDRKYLDFFFDHALPNWMTTGNLLGFASRDAEFDIYTTENEAAELAQSSRLAALVNFIPIRLSVLNGVTAPTGQDKMRYVLMTDMHKLAIARADETNAAIFFLGPDVAFADGTLTHARDLLESGKRLIMIGSIRVSSAGYIAEVTSRFNPRRTLAAQLPPRDLVDLIVRHPHEGNATFTWGNPELVNWPAHLYFPVGDEGFVQRGFHLHPLAINAERRGLRPTFSVDDAWLTEIVPNRDDWHIVQDSDDGYAVDFGAPPEILIPARARPDPLMHVAAWAKHHTQPLQWWLAQHPVLVHRAPLTPAWDAVVEASDAAIAGVIERIPAAPEWVAE